MRIRLNILTILFVCLLCVAQTSGAEEKDVFAELWGYRIFSENNQYGLMNGNENVAISATYDIIIPDEKAEAFCLIEGKKRGAAIVVDGALKLVPAVYDDIYFGDDQLWYCIQGEYRCILNQWGEELVPLLGPDAITISDDVCVLSYQSPCSYYLINEKKQVATQWDEMGDFDNSLAPVEKDGLWGYIDSDNREVISCQFLNARSFQNGLAWVGDEEGHFCAIDTKGNLQFILDKLIPETDFSEYGTAFVWEEESQLYNLIDRNGKLIDENGWHMEYTEPDENGCFIALAENGCWGVINWKGETVVPFETVPDTDRALLSFQDGLCIASLGYDGSEERFRVYNSIGELMCEFGTDSFSGPSPFSEGLSLIGEIDHDYFLNPDGHIELEIGEGYRCSYSNGSFSEGLSCIASQGKYGYMNHQGGIVIPNQYHYAHAFRNGFAKVTTEQGETGYINHMGEYIVLLSNEPEK